MNLPESLVDIHVPFHDADPAGFVWHGRYFKYFEAARRTLLEQLDYSHQGMVDSGYIWPIVDARVKYVRPLKYDQHIKVHAHITEWELRLVLDYHIQDQEQQVTTRGRTIQVPVAIETGEMRLGSPPQLIERIEATASGQKKA